MRPRLFDALLLTTSLVVVGCSGRPPAATTADRRQAIALPIEAQDAVRAEMNTMLMSLNRILTALPRQDTTAIREAAAASGLAKAADPTLEHLLPQQFLTWGTATHRGFDGLAASIAAGAPRDTTIAQLGAILQTCVTCHATYRLAAR